MDGLSPRCLGCQVEEDMVYEWILVQSEASGSSVRRGGRDFAGCVDVSVDEVSRLVRCCKAT